MQACELWQIVSTDYHFKEKPVFFHGGGRRGGHPWCPFRAIDFAP